MTANALLMKVNFLGSLSVKCFDCCKTLAELSLFSTVCHRNILANYIIEECHLLSQGSAITFVFSGLAGVNTVAVYCHQGVVLISLTSI